jgi:hypothetical protein
MPSCDSAKARDSAPVSAAPAYQRAQSTTAAMKEAAQPRPSTKRAASSASPLRASPCAAAPSTARPVSAATVRRGPTAVEGEASRDLRQQQRQEEHPVRRAQHGRRGGEVARHLRRHDAERGAVELRQRRHARERGEQRERGAAGRRRGGPDVPRVRGEHARRGVLGHGPRRPGPAGIVPASRRADRPVRRHGDRSRASVTASRPGPRWPGVDRLPIPFATAARGAYRNIVSARSASASRPGRPR